MLPHNVGLQIYWLGHNIISLKSNAGVSVLTAWVAGFRYINLTDNTCVSGVRPIAKRVFRMPWPVFCQATITQKNVKIW